MIQEAWTWWMMRMRWLSHLRPMKHLCTPCILNSLLLVRGYKHLWVWMMRIKLMDSGVCWKRLFVSIFSWLLQGFLIILKVFVKNTVDFFFKGLIWFYIVDIVLEYITFLCCQNVWSWWPTWGNPFIFFWCSFWNHLSWIYQIVNI